MSAFRILNRLAASGEWHLSGKRHPRQVLVARDFAAGEVWSTDSSRGNFPRRLPKRIAGSAWLSRLLSANRDTQIV